MGHAVVMLGHTVVRLEVHILPESQFLSIEVMLSSRIALLSVDTVTGTKILPWIFMKINHIYRMYLIGNDIPQSDFDRTASHVISPCRTRTY